VSKITSKYQVGIPKALADRAGVRPGDDVEWQVAGGELRGRPANGAQSLSTEERLRLFREAMKRVANRKKEAPFKPGESRGWTRDELYDRGRTR